MAGKGDRMRSGYNHKKFIAGFENIDWGRTTHVKPLSRSEIIDELNGARINLRRLILAGGQDTSGYEARINSLLGMLDDIDGTNK